MKLFELCAVNGNMLLEKLGNLTNLKVGWMIEILKQQEYNTKHRSGESQIGNKFNGMGDPARVGAESEIIDAGKINGISDLRKAYKKHDDSNVAAFALYVDNKAVAFGKYDSYSLSGSSRTGIFAFDLNMFKADIEAATEAKKAAADKWEKNYIRMRDLVSYYENDRPSYRMKDGETNKKDRYAGKSMSTGDLKSFLEELLMLAGDKSVTCKLVIADNKGNTKRRDRYQNLTKDEVFTGLEALQLRLKKFKLAKMPTVDTIDEFIAAVKNETAKVVQFAGRTFSTIGTANSKIDPTALIKGFTAIFRISYSTTDPGEYDSLNISYALNPKNGSLTPWKAEYSARSNGGGRQHITAVLDTPAYMRYEHGAKSMEKDEVLKAVLTKLKDGSLDAVQKILDALAKDKIDWPELKAIEKSLAIEKAKKD